MTGDTVLVLCSTDPHQVREGWTSLDLPSLGIDQDQRALMTDLLTGEQFDWGQYNFVRLSPERPAHILSVHPIR